MSQDFNKIMKKFYDDPKLGIKNEEVPANNASSGGVSLPPDVRYQKDKKKKAQDQARKWITYTEGEEERVEALKLKRKALGI